jgi:hypothetical protein
VMATAAAGLPVRLRIPVLVTSALALLGGL